MGGARLRQLCEAVVRTTAVSADTGFELRPSSTGTGAGVSGSTAAPESACCWQMKQPAGSPAGERFPFDGAAPSPGAARSRNAPASAVCAEAGWTCEFTTMHWKAIASAQSHERTAERARALRSGPRLKAFNARFANPIARPALGACCLHPYRPAGCYCIASRSANDDGAATKSCCLRPNAARGIPARSGRTAMSTRPAFAMRERTASCWPWPNSRPIHPPGFSSEGASWRIARCAASASSPGVSAIRGS